MKMKKTLLIAGLVCVTIIPPAAAVTKCVALNSNTTCDTGDGTSGNVVVNATCTTNGTSVDVQIVGSLSSTRGTSEGETKDSIKETNSAPSSSNRLYCWCKMISPAVSKWVYAYYTTNSSDMCSATCSRYLSFNDDFRNALFSNLSD